MTSSVSLGHTSKFPKSSRKRTHESISAARQDDEAMEEKLKLSGASSFFTLVRYNAPTVINDEEEEYSENKEESEDDEEGEESVEVLLNTVLPPREWEHEGCRWRRSVSVEAASRPDVQYLGQMLDIKLKERLAQPDGICQVRRELYGQLFEEIIRQSLVSCKERGMLLLRVRNELKQTLLAYKELFLRSVQFGKEKIEQAEEGREERRDRLRSLEKQKAESSREVLMWKAELEMRTQAVKTLAENQQHKFYLEMKKYNALNLQLKLQLDLMPPIFLENSAF